MTSNNPYGVQRSGLWNATVLFVLVSGLLIAVDQLSILCGLQGSQRIADDLLGGLVAGSIFHLYERQRRRRCREQLHLIDLVNHHVRNALQPLMLVTDQSEGKPEARLVEECVRRIEWTLREVLPGNSADFFSFTGGFAGKSRLTIGSPEAASSPAIKHSRSGGPNRQPGSFFSQWLDTWRRRNERAS